VCVRVCAQSSRRECRCFSLLLELVAISYRIFWGNVSRSLTRFEFLWGSEISFFFLFWKWLQFAVVFLRLHFDERMKKLLWTWSAVFLFGVCENSLVRGGFFCCCCWWWWWWWCCETSIFFFQEYFSYYFLLEEVFLRALQYGERRCSSYVLRYPDCHPFAASRRVPKVWLHGKDPILLYTRVPVVVVVARQSA